MAKRKSTQTRAIVLDVLMELLPGKEIISDVKENLLLGDVLDKYDYMEVRDKALIKRLTEGCVERVITLDYVIDSFSKTNTRKMKPVILNILRMGVYQILYMDTVPDSAACNEAVNLAADKGFHGLTGFVNGILRTVVREKDNIPWPEKKNIDYYLSVRYSMPEWLVHMWLERFGEETAEKMLNAFQMPSEVMVRMKETLTKEQRSTWEKEIQGQGCQVRQHPWRFPGRSSYLPYAYSLKNLDGIGKLYGYEEGMFAVQDISSMLAVELAGIKKGDFVIDVCAAPGGKAMHAAEKTGKDGFVMARDISLHKIMRMEENAKRLLPDMFAAGSIKIEQWDALEPDETMTEKADVVLADLPCSGLGVIGRKGDIRYRISREQITELAELQRKILETVYRYLKPGGILMYSTCTVSEDENEKNRLWILKNLSLEPVAFEEQLPKQLRGMTGTEGYLQLLPGVHESDGFFMAKFRKRME